jgi:hypothetical protein
MSRRAASMAAMANRSNNPQDIQAIQKSLVDGVQNGSIQPYVGIPLIQELTQRLTEVKAQMAQTMAGAGMPQPQQGQQAPPIAQQVMQQAAQESQGLESLPSNLPQEYAGGGIIAFEGGGEVQRFNEGLLVDANYPDSYYRSQEAEVQPDPKSIESYVQQYKALMPPKGATQTEYEEYLKKRSGDAEANKKQDLNLALAQFGLNLAAGKSPRALENLGEAGIKTLPAVQEAYKQRRLADETSLRGRAELERMARAEEIDALKGGLGLYGEERKLTADEKKAELQRQNAIAVAKLQREGYKPTDLDNYIRNYVTNEIKNGSTRSPEALALEATNKFPGFVVKREVAGIAADTGAGAQALTAQQLSQQAIDKATDNYSKALENRKDPITIESNRLKKLDIENRKQGNPTNLQLEHRNKTISDNANSMTPSSQQRKVVPPPVAKPGARLNVLPPGAVLEGTSGGKKVYKLPDGSRYIEK